MTLYRAPRPRTAPPGGEGRLLDCRRYDGCLDIAIARDWPGFDCIGCPAYVPFDRAELRRQVRALVALALHVLALLGVVPRCWLIPDHHREGWKGKEDR